MANSVPGYALAVERTIPGELLGTTCFASGETDALQTRSILLFRRLEAGDTAHAEGRTMSESPFIEGRVFRIAIATHLYAELKELCEAEDAFFAKPSKFRPRVEPFALAVAIGGGGALCAWLGFLPRSWMLFFLVVAALGWMLLLWMRARLSHLNEEQEQLWNQSEPGKQAAELQRRLRERWARVANLARDSGYAVELRVAEGGAEPASLRSMFPALGDRDASFHEVDLQARDEPEYILQRGLSKERRTFSASTSPETAAIVDDAKKSKAP